jgi:hypothetical protein
LYITATPTFNLGKNQIRNLYYISDILPKGLGARVGSIPQESAFKLRKFPRPIRIIIYDSDGNVVSDTTQNGDGADKMDTPLYNAKYYSHQPTSVDTITKYDEEFKEVTDSTNFVHIRKKPPIIQTIVLPPPPPPAPIVYSGGDVPNDTVIPDDDPNGVTYTEQTIRIMDDGTGDDGSAPEYLTLIKGSDGSEKWSFESFNGRATTYSSSIINLDNNGKVIPISSESAYLSTKYEKEAKAMDAMIEMTKNVLAKDQALREASSGGVIEDGNEQGGADVNWKQNNDGSVDHSVIYDYDNTTNDNADTFMVHSDGGGLDVMSTVELYDTKVINDLGV